MAISNKKFEIAIIVIFLLKRKISVFAITPRSHTRYTFKKAIHRRDRRKAHHISDFTIGKIARKKIAKLLKAFVSQIFCGGVPRLPEILSLQMLS